MNYFISALAVVVVNAVVVFINILVVVIVVFNAIVVFIYVLAVVAVVFLIV